MIGANCVFLIGEVADIRTPSPKVMSLRVKVTESYVSPDGEVKQRSGTHKVSVFGERRVAFLGRALVVGSAVLVQGRLENRSWENRDGVKQWETGVSATDVTPLEHSAPRQPQRPEPAFDDDIPF